MIVFWGSQSGTAERFANRLTQEIHRRFGIAALAADLSDYDPASIALIPPSKVAIFILSTFGEGDPSDNTHELWSWLETEKKADLSAVRYAAFGLGNKNYNLYNRVVNVVTQGLDRLGAKSLMAVGRADDSMGTTEEDFLEWKEALFSMFAIDLRLPQKEVQYEPNMSVVEDDSMVSIDLHNGVPIPPRETKRTALTSSAIQPLPVKIAKELLTTPTRNCLHLELDLSQYPELKYKTGDHLGVWPTNPDNEVERLLKVLHLQEKKVVPISLASLDPSAKLKIPTPTTIEVLFRYYLEICGPVSRDTVLSLAQFAQTPDVKAFLIKLGKDRDAYAQYESKNHINLGRFLESMADAGESWASLPFSFVLEILPVIQPRYYSISSSSIVQPRQAAITAVVTQEPLSIDPSKRIPGLATNYMLALKQSLTDHGMSLPHPHGLTYNLKGPDKVLDGGKLHVHVRKSKFKLPVASNHPIIMIASGTGIAPFRGFLAERVRLKSMGRDVGRHLLFFGCRHAEEDYLYQEELSQFKKALEDKLEIFTAFSRQQSNANGSRLYVQDRLDEHFADVSSLLLDLGAHTYVCGSASMARDVTKRLYACLKGERGWDEGVSSAWLKQQKLIKRWQEDVWG